MIVIGMVVGMMAGTMGCRTARKEASALRVNGVVTDSLSLDRSGEWIAWEWFGSRETADSVSVTLEADSVTLTQEGSQTVRVYRPRVRKQTVRPLVETHRATADTLQWESVRRQKSHSTVSMEGSKSLEKQSRTAWWPGAVVVLMGMALLVGVLKVLRGSAHA